MVWKEGWSYRKSHIINPQSGAGTGYQTPIIVYYGSGTDGTESIHGITYGKVHCNNHCKTDFGDIRFTDDDGTTDLDYWMEDKDSNRALFWVKVNDSLESTAATIYVYYGNASATYTDARTKGTNTFLFFDGEGWGGSLDSNKWKSNTADAGTTISITGGNLQFNCTTGYAHTGGVITSKNMLPAGNKACMFKVKSTNGYASAFGAYGGFTTDDHYGTYYSLPYDYAVGKIYRYSGPYKALSTHYLNIGSTAGTTVTTLYNVWWKVQTNMFPNSECKGVYHQLESPWESDTLTVSDSTGIDGRYCCLGIGEYNTVVTAYFDWVAVRQLTSPEPAHGAWGTEETESQGDDLVVGNLTVNGNMTANNMIESKENFYIPSSYNAWLSYMSNDSATFPETNGKIRFSDITEGLGDDSGNYTDMVGGLWRTANGFSATAPFILTRHHLVVKKDLFCKGQVVSMEGCLTLYGGYAEWITPHTHSPIVWLARSGEGAQYCNFEIRKSDWSFGNIKAGVIQGACLDNGAGSGDAFLIGDDCYLVDVNEDNTVCLQGAQNRANAKIYFGNGKDTNLYRSDYTILKTDSNFTLGGSSLLQDPATENPVFNQKKGGADRMSLGHNGTDGVLSCWTGKLLLASPQSIDTNRKLRINPTSDQPVLEFRLNGAERIFIGHNGTDSFVSSRSGKLQLNTVSGNIELSATSGEVIINQPMSAQALKIGGTEVITSARVLQNVSGITYGMTSFADQNLNKANDAIFNSVLGTASGAFKVGTAGGTTYVSLTRSGSTGYVTAHYGTMYLVGNSGIRLTPSGGTVYCEGAFSPTGAGSYNQGSSGAYWNEVNAKSFPDRGCPIWIEPHEAREILKGIKPHPMLKSANKFKGKEVPQFDYSSLPEILKPNEGDGIRIEALLYTVYHVVRDLIERVEALEMKTG